MSCLRCVRIIISAYFVYTTESGIGEEAWLGSRCYIAVAEGRIEATDNIRIMGFKDDIVIRVQAMGNRARVDMRSASWVGESDLGVNAARIQHSLDDLGKL